MDRLLLQHGTVIDTEPVAVHADTDVLIEDGRIAAVGPGLDATGAEVVDATDRIVVPGFVDTHRHGWQSVLRASAMDLDLMGYMGLLNGQIAPTLQPADLAVAAELTGLECLDAGITTLQDYAHIVYSPAHADAVVGGLQASGVRAAFGYSQPVFASPEQWRTDDARRVRERLLPDDDALVTMMLAAMGPSFAAPEVVESDWKLAAELGVRLVTHIGATADVPNPIRTLGERGLLREGTLYVHGNSLTDEDLRLIAGSGGTLSITPAIEARMSIGAPTLGRTRRFGVTAGLGVDVVTSGPGDPFSLMRAALMSEDATDGEHVPVADVLALATLGGATAMGLQDRVGSLRPGKQADVVLIRTDDVSTVGGHNPIGTVLSAHPGVVEAVLVAGRFVKRDGRLLRGRVGEVVAEAKKIAVRLAG
jgi:cytosine/adenosine deaminase-related metal-dependent hydrolase